MYARMAVNFKAHPDLTGSYTADKELLRTVVLKILRQDAALLGEFRVNSAGKPGYAYRVTMTAVIAYVYDNRLPVVTVKNITNNVNKDLKMMGVLELVARGASRGDQPTASEWWVHDPTAKPEPQGKRAKRGKPAKPASLHREAPMVEPATEVPPEPAAVADEDQAVTEPVTVAELPAETPPAEPATEVPTEPAALPALPEPVLSGELVTGLLDQIYSLPEPKARALCYKFALDNAYLVRRLDEMSAKLAHKSALLLLAVDE